MTYTAPLRDMLFTLEPIAGIDEIWRGLPVYHEATPDLRASVLEEAGRFAGERAGAAEPHRRPARAAGSRTASCARPTASATPIGSSSTAAGTACRSIPTMAARACPGSLATAVQEMWDGANMAFGLCPLLTQAAVERWHTHRHAGAEARCIWRSWSTADWTGTMNLTEPQAGSDVGALRTRAVKDGDHYRITGQKIFITYGDHDMAENIVHMVLARTPDAPPGVKGISLFIVPKFLVGADGKLGDAQRLCAASRSSTSWASTAARPASWPMATTAAPSAELVGEENRGIEYMFTMMNNARLSVGIEGLAHRRARLSAGARLCAPARPGPRRRRQPTVSRCRSSAIPTCGAC